MSLRILLALIVAVLSAAAFGQDSASAASASSSFVADLDTYAKVIGVVLTALATLFGLPIVFLTYKKTRAEIAKLDLEATALRAKLPAQTEGVTSEESASSTEFSEQPNLDVKVVTDPRFLAPLLLLLDFVLAWVVLTLAGHLLGVFGLGIVRALALAILAAVLLLPIAKQVLRVRSVLRPLESPEEVRASISQVKMVVYTIYAMMILSAFLSSGLLLFIEDETYPGVLRLFAWGLLALGAALTLCIPIVKPRIDRYLATLLDPATSEGPTLR